MWLFWRVTTYHRATPRNCKTPFFILGPIWQGGIVERSTIWLNEEIKVPFLFRQTLLMCVLHYVYLFRYVWYCTKLWLPGQGQLHPVLQGTSLWVPKCQALPQTLDRPRALEPTLLLPATKSFFLNNVLVSFQGVKPKNFISRLLCSWEWSCAWCDQWEVSVI